MEFSQTFIIKIYVSGIEIFRRSARCSRLGKNNIIREYMNIKNFNSALHKIQAVEQALPRAKNI